MSTDGVVRWCKFSEGLRHSLSGGQGLHEETYAHDYFKTGVIPVGRHQVRASAWGFSGADRRVFEESIAMPQYNSVATILWDRDGDSDEEADEESEEPRHWGSHRNRD